jgi:hypothetical protein
MGFRVCVRTLYPVPQAPRNPGLTSETWVTTKGSSASFTPWSYFHSQISTPSFIGF